MQFKFIAEEKRSGSPLIDVHLLVRHKRYAIPLSVFILTIIAVAVSSFKRRGGMGVNLAFGIITGFTFIFFDKIFGVLVDKTDLGALIQKSSFEIVWFRVVIATILIALYFIFLKPSLFKVTPKAMLSFFLGGLLISVHWILFFHAIKISSVSITLSVMSSASLMTSILEPIFYK